MVDNNVCETFNGYIIKARGRPIIDLLDDIMQALMERMHTKLSKMSGVTDIICPRIRSKLEEIKYNSRLCSIKPAVGDKFQVSIGEDRFVVDITKWTCACREWQITGIPCIHAVASINWLNKDPVNFVDPYYSVENYIQTYKHALEPINGEKMWPKADGLPIKPPHVKKMSGRPKISRRRAPEEDPKNPTKLTRCGIQMTCQVCEGEGHNKRTCKMIHIQGFQRPTKLQVTSTNSTSSI